MFEKLRKRLLYKYEVIESSKNPYIEITDSAVRRQRRYKFWYRFLGGRKI